MNRRALFLVNPESSGAQCDLGPALADFAAAGWEVERHDTRDRDESRHRIREADRDHHALLLGGGDGTISGVLDAVVESGLPLGIIPLGTANDLARTLAIPDDPAEALAIVARGMRRSIDLGRVNGRHFLNVASVGLSVETSRALDDSPKRALGTLSYALSAARGVRRARTFRARVECDGVGGEFHSLQIAIANGRHYGGGMTVLDDATLCDQRLVFWSLEPQPLWRLALNLPRYRWGLLRGLPTARLQTGTRIEVVTDRPMPLDVDGEIEGETPAYFDVVPAALTVFAPGES